MDVNITLKPRPALSVFSAKRGTRPWFPIINKSRKYVYMSTLARGFYQHWFSCRCLHFRRKAFTQIIPCAVKHQNVYCSLPLSILQPPLGSNNCECCYYSWLLQHISWLCFTASGCCSSRSLHSGPLHSNFLPHATALSVNRTDLLSHSGIPNSFTHHLFI